MIGKITPGTALSGTGTVSAKPSGMENNALTSDFGSLLRMSGQQGQSRTDEDEIEHSRFDLESFVSVDSAPAENRDTTINLAFINQSVGKATLEENKIAQKSADYLKAFTHDGKLASEYVQSIELEEPGALAKFGGTLTGLDSEISPPPNRYSVGPDAHIDRMAIEGTKNIVAGSAPNHDLQPERADALVGQNTKTSHNVRNADEAALRSESLPAAKTTATGLDVPSQLLSNKAASSGTETRFAGILQTESKGRARQDQGAELEQMGSSSASREQTPVASTDLRMSAINNGKNIEPGKLGVPDTQAGTKVGEQKDTLSELDRSGYRAVPRDQALGSTGDLRAHALGSAKGVEPIELDIQPKAKPFELSVEQQLPANSVPAPLVREPMQKLATFDMSTPHIAQRLATQIVDVSENGEVKKFELNPRNLGRMEIIFNTRGAAEFIEIQTERMAAKDVIMQHSQLLQDILKSQGREDLTLRVDVRENMFSSSRNDSSNFSQQENRDFREERARPPQSKASEVLSSSEENKLASDNNRYA